MREIIKSVYYCDELSCGMPDLELSDPLLLKERRRI